MNGRQIEGLMCSDPSVPAVYINKLSRAVSFLLRARTMRAQ